MVATTKLWANRERVKGEEGLCEAEQKILVMH